MGPDPFSMPGFGAPNASAMLQQQVGQLAPLATRYSGPAHGVPIAQAFSAPSQPAQGGALSQFLHFLGGTATQIGHIAGGAASWLAKNGVQAAESIPKFAYDSGVGAYRTFEQNNQVNALNARQQNLTNMWKNGKISSSKFNNEMKDILNQRNDLTDQIKTTQKMLSNSKTEGIQAASLLVAIATDGLSTEATGGEMAAAAYLKSAGTDNFVSGVEQAVSKLATNADLFAKLEPAAQKAIQTATAEVIAGAGARASASQVARGAAINLALKYPVYYNYLSTTGAQIYNELDNKKYGDAIRTVAFNAALMLSGGPIGKALKYGGKALDSVSAKTFGQTSFWDELSGFYGDGSKQGFALSVSRMAQDMAPAEREQFLKNLSAVEATNVAAVGGDVGAAAARVGKGMQAMYGDGIDLTSISHEDGIKDMVNYAQAYRLASDEAQRLGLPDIAIGRVDARQLNVISSQIAPTIEGSKSVAKDAWEALKAQNPNQAWANNENFDKQIVGIINKYSTPGEIDQAIRNIKASFNVEKFSSKVESQLAKMGYIPIKPVSLEAPFKEGSGKLVSSFGNPDFFMQSVKPLPILSSLGDAMTSLGLSPNASTQKVYQLFNDNLAKNLQEGGAIEKIMGEDVHQSTDTLIKKLSDYAHNPTRGKIMSKMPISDLRMLTNKDIQTALDVSSSKASAIQNAITESYIQVPLAIRGLGDRAVDISYKGVVGAGMRRYLRIQSSLRYAWNPFFSYLKLAPKTEILSSAEGGGYISSIFSGKVGQINDIRKELRSVGAFEEPGHLGNVLSGEATELGGATGRNLTKKLLPAQERSIAGLVSAQADRMGMDAKTYINTFPDQVRDTVQMITQYDRRANFLNSPLARTLNIAVFPFRFDTKVATIFARSLARTAPMTQVAVINGLLKTHDFLNSDEGKAWYSKNADAIGLFKYITPVASFAEIFSSLLPGHDHSLGNFGELGGLPFGWIPQVLDAEGLTHFNQPGASPKTGEAYTQYIPTTMKGQVATAIQDFISSVFSYPGATIGLPSKTKAAQAISFGFVGANKNVDFQKVTPQASTEQLNFQQAVQQANPTNPGLSQTQQQETQAQGISRSQQPTPSISSSSLNQGTTVPRLPSQLDSMPGKLSKSGGSPKKKKSDYTPYLLPGQTQLGQL